MTYRKTTCGGVNYYHCPECGSGWRNTSDARECFNSHSDVTVTCRIKYGSQQRQKKVKVVA